MDAVAECYISLQQGSKYQSSHLSSLLRLLAALSSALGSSGLGLSKRSSRDVSNRRTGRSKVIALIAKCVLQIHISNRLHAARDPLLEWLGDKVSVCCEPGSEGVSELSGAR